MASFFATSGVDSLIGGTAADAFYAYDPAHVGAGDVFDGGARVDVISVGTASINVDQTYDFRATTIRSIEAFYFANAVGPTQAGARTAIFSGDQFGSLIVPAGSPAQTGLSALTGFGGTDGRDTLVFNLEVKATFDLSRASFANWDSFYDIVVIQGDASNESIRGSHVKDEILAGDGNDTILVSAGDDIYNGGLGVDTVNLNGGTSGFGLDLDVTGNGTTTVGGLGTLSLISIENVTGGFFADQINGSAAANVLSGLQGNDILLGRGGNDTLDGGEGDDNLQGGDGADRVFGGVGNDTLFGDAGNDTLDGGYGDDVLNGGAGRDIFRMTANGNNDTIVGFQDGFDRIDMRTSVTTAFSGLTITDNGVDTTVTYASANHIVIKGVLASAVTAADFIF